MKLTKKFFCPVNGWDCPYWKEDGSCELLDLGDNPLVECDDASFYIDESDELIDCAVWEDENGNRYDIQELLQRGYHIVNGEPEKAPSSDFIRGTLRKIHENCDEEVSFPPEFDEMGSNGFRG